VILDFLEGGKQASDGISSRRRNGGKLAGQLATRFTAGGGTWLCDIALPCHSGTARAIHQQVTAQFVSSHFDPPPVARAIKCDLPVRSCFAPRSVSLWRDDRLTTRGLKPPPKTSQVEFRVDVWLDLDLQVLAQRGAPLMTPTA
jgi:hypothetical protein